MLRGSYAAVIDSKGRLNIPSTFRRVLEQEYGIDLFVTSLTGESVRIYPLKVWTAVEEKLALMPANHPSRLKFLDRVNYYGQTGDLDGQGRVLIPQRLRESASIKGEVRVFGRIDYMDVWNTDQFLKKLTREPWSDEDGLSLSEYGI